MSADYLIRPVFVLLLALVARPVWAAVPITTSFTYQGVLSDGGAIADGDYDLRFVLYDDESGTKIIGAAITMLDYAVVDGLFTVELDFGAEAFATQSAWLEVRVRDAADDGNFTVLNPRQAVTAVPYAMHTRGIGVDDGGDVEICRGEATGGLTRSLTIGGARDSAGSSFGQLIFQNYDGSNQTPEDYAAAIIQSHNTGGGERGDLRFYTRGSGDDQGNLGALGLSMEVKASGAVDIAGSVEIGGVFNNPANLDRVLSIAGEESAGITLNRITNDTTWSIGSTSGDLLTWSRDTNNGSLDVMTLTRGGRLNLGAVDTGNVFSLLGNGGTSAVGITQNEYASTKAMEFTTSDSADEQATRMVLRGGQDDEEIEFLTGARGSETQVMAIDGATGNVSIGGGTNNPANFSRVLSLQASGSAAATFTRLDGGTTWSAGVTSGNGFTFFRDNDTDTVNVLTMTEDGKVGISRNSPDAQLEVAGGNTAIRGEADTSLAANFFAGVRGVADGGSGTNYGVYGNASGGSTNYAGFFDGRVHANGTLSKSAGSFKIDHPLDPANKYLSHSFVESPDMLNIYNGNIVTDGEGFAVVEMPDWFEALNSEFRYQLTVIGSFARAMVAEELRDGVFVIQTDEPGIKVSWQVTGIRHDPYAQAHRIPTEEIKPAHERGLYLHPELYGKDKSYFVADPVGRKASDANMAEAAAR